MSGTSRSVVTGPDAAVPSPFLPKLVTVLREGYSPADLRADAIAGLTVAIVALPLSMAIAIASGVGPERGLYTAIVGGFLVSTFGGSRYQIGGPAGAFIVLVAACVTQIGLPGLLLATLLSGAMLLALGMARLGTYIRFIPYPVTLGFTAGIAVIIFASQLRDLFGLHLPGAEPSELLHKLSALWAARETVSGPALLVSLVTVALILGLRRLAPRWPAMLIAVAAMSVLAALGLPVETVGSRFGALPRLLPAPALPPMGAEAVLAALPWAVSFTLLGAIESLLSAVVADGMSGRQHRPNAELIAQGIANIGSGLFGGFCVTGTIARTATNVRSGSRGPVSGMLHAVFLALALLVAAPLAAYIPLAALAGVLATVAWNMIERHEIAGMIRASRVDAAVMVVTFLLVIFRDLSAGIVVGFALSGLVFVKRMSDAAEVAPHADAVADPGREDRVIYRLSGPFFFGAAAQLGAVLDRIADHPRVVIVDFSAVPLIDTSGARSLELLATKLRKRGGALWFVGMRPRVAVELRRAGLAEPHIPHFPDLAAAEAALPD
ncbi:SulP family inorganic anion transporter [Gemmobacter caeruleus]|uniref:SulP family inorganic anion transporter n=1 Tax=Gemmobacter caeruleus TaxID=2595004 RepID=UPI0011EC943F|nr:SulP family inorganic anion transporter [Gemmobacter caeruleus]